MRIGFPGERGAYAEAAAAALFDFDIATRPLSSYAAVFDALESQDISLGILPLENNYAGSFHEVYDLLRERDAYITNEIQVPTTFVLAGAKGAREADVKRIYAHPVALAQCESYVRSLAEIDLIPRYDIEKSDRELAERRSPEEATLCSRFAAMIHGLAILRENCNTLPDSATRYIAVASAPRLPKAMEGDPVTMLLFELPHKPGALMRCLQAFADGGVNILTLETRPTRVKDWEYTTFVTFAGRYDAPEVTGIIDRLAPHTTYLRHLGSYVIRGATLDEA